MSRVKLPRLDACLLMLIIAVLPTISIAKPVMTTDLLQSLRKGEPWDRGVLSATKTVLFQQSASSGTDATSISKITLAYFTSSNCTGSTAGSGFYTTPDGTSFPISVGTLFAIDAASVWNVGNTQLSISTTDMATIQSIAVTFKSTNNNTPQAAFTNASNQVISYACVPVSCTGGECTSGSGTQSFTLKTTAAVGDPADGGVIGCQNTGVSFNLFNIVVTTSNQTPQVWGGSGININATSTTNGAVNTSTIVNCLTNGFGGGCAGSSIPENTYAAGNCSTYSAAGGFTRGWFLPSGSVTNSQLNCLYNNRVAIATGAVAAGGSGFSSAIYWSSTQSNSSNAWSQNLSDGSRSTGSKNSSRSIRCARAF